MPRARTIRSAAPRSSVTRVRTTRRCGGRSRRCWRGMPVLASSGRRRCSHRRHSPGRTRPPAPYSWPPGRNWGPIRFSASWERAVWARSTGPLIPGCIARSRSRFPAARFSERFAREVRAIATLNHPNICTLHDVGPNYLVMELVEGETLRDWFRRALPMERSLEIATPGPGGAGRGASGGHCSSRLEARKRHGPRRWLREGAGFRPWRRGCRTWARQHSRMLPTTDHQRVSRPGQILGTVRLHVTGTDPRPRRRSAQ